MNMRRLILGSLVAATLGVSIPAAARTNVYLNFAPPPVRYAYVPAPRAGFVWVPGHWDWRGHRHVFVRGHWIRHRAGYHYQPAVWMADGGRWRFHRPYWR